MQKFCSATHPLHSMTVGKTCWHCRKPHSQLCQPAPHSLVCGVKSCCQIFYTAVTSVPLVVNQKILINLHSLLCKCRKKSSIFSIYYCSCYSRNSLPSETSEAGQSILMFERSTVALCRMWITTLTQ